MSSEACGRLAAIRRKRRVPPRLRPLLHRRHHRQRFGRQGTPHGLTVSSFTSVSLDPPLILICLGHRVTVIEAFRAARYFGISVLAENQRELSERFARKGHDRFDGVEWHCGATGAPLLNGVLAAIECEVHQRFTAGDHDIFVGRMLRAQVRDGAPLIYYASRYRTLAE